MERDRIELEGKDKVKQLQSQVEAPLQPVPAVGLYPRQTSLET